MKRRIVQAIAAASALWIAMPVAAQRNTPIRIVVMASPGGAADYIGRLVAQELTTVVNRPVVVENKPGGGGNIATQFVAKAPPDGNTLLVTSNNHTINVSLYRKPGYQLEDLTPVSYLARGPNVVVVHPTAKQKSMKEFIDGAKSVPLAYGTAGIGSGAHLVAECLKQLTGAKLEHVPYKGGGPAVNDLLGAQVPSVVGTLVSAGQFVRTGQLSALAVSGPERWPSMPEIPTLKESGYGECTYETYIGLLAPKGTPDSVLNTLNQQVASILNDPQVREKLLQQGYAPQGGDRQNFIDFLASDFKKTSTLIRQANIQAE